MIPKEILKKIELVQGDITREETEAIVNAANTSLLGGGGVDGAIHRAGGRAILEECKKIGGCPTGEARITTGGNLKAKYVIHTVGPVYRDGNHGEPELLANAHRNSFRLAVENGIESLSFPAISTGVYGYPLREAAKIAIGAIAKELEANSSVQLVRFVLFDQTALDAYNEVLDGLVD
ncbi:MAG: O-acetyl-ADP-ribose deacetylase [Candidatus Omnitrophica bacterium]|nr:O-acetyl-ADP-ribose deacetylase [Candidatus Omnitrophota bacterium]